MSFLTLFTIVIFLVTVISLLNERFDEATKYLQTGVDINAKDAQGRTPLIHAILGKNPLEATKFLIEEGANVNTA